MKTQMRPFLIRSRRWTNLFFFCCLSPNVLNFEMNVRMRVCVCAYVYMYATNVFVQRARIFYKTIYVSNDDDE